MVLCQEWEAVGGADPITTARHPRSHHESHTTPPLSLQKSVLDVLQQIQPPQCSSA